MSDRAGGAAATAPPTGGPLPAYRALLAEGRLQPDMMQALAAEKLQSLHLALRRHHPQDGAAGWRARLGLARRPDPAPQGLYLYGAVGRGKTMLLDLFYGTAPVAARRRVHFHAFMLDVHARLHRRRQDARHGRRPVDDQIRELARELAGEAWLLCFDEFHVTDVADAMILGRLFTAFFDLGVVVVATSNWAPDRLYEGGLQRDLFLPFIALLKDRLDVLDLAGDRDYRRERIRGIKVYHYPLGPAATAALDAAFRELTDGAEPVPSRLTVQGRSIAVPLAARGVARFDFAGLCGQPLGAADYLAIAGAFHTVVLDGVPRLSDSRRDETRRFITLIDALYEHRVKVVIAADAAPDRLLAGGVHGFEFERTVSRLIEMQSADWLARPEEAPRPA